MSKKLDLAGRTAIITGAGRGLGRCHALELSKDGANIIVNDLSSEDVMAVVEEIRSSGGNAIGFVGSVTDATAMQDMVSKAMAEFGRIDILVNNAGILRDKSFAKMDLDDFRLVMDVHVMGAVTCTKAVWEIMRSQRYGRIVMTTSSSGLYGNFGQANYGAAKMALVGLMQTLAIEGEKYGIKVNCLAPTAATQMTDGVLAEDALEALDPALVSPAVAFLSSEGAPTRAILCAGAGNFSVANITLSPGYYVGKNHNAAQQVGLNWSRIVDRTDAIVPEYGFMQAESELASAGLGMGEIMAHG